MAPMMTCERVGGVRSVVFRLIGVRKNDDRNCDISIISGHGYGWMKKDQIGADFWSNDIESDPGVGVSEVKNRGLRPTCDKNNLDHTARSPDIGLCGARLGSQKLRKI